MIIGMQQLSKKDSTQPTSNHKKELIQIVFIILATIILLFLVFKGEELPKFVYNSVERQSAQPLQDLIDKSDKIVNLIEEKKYVAGMALNNPGSTVSAQDLNSYTLQVMNSFENGRSDINTIDRYLSIQSKIPLLPPAYRDYHNKKIEWFTVHKKWFEALKKIKTAEQQMSDQVNQMTNVVDIMRKTTVDYGTGLNYASAAASITNGILSGIDRMEKDNMMIPEIKQYFIHMKERISIIQDLHTRILNDPTFTPNNYVFELNKRLNTIPEDKNYPELYAQWRTTCIAPLEPEKEAYYESSINQFNELLDLKQRTKIMEDAISVWLYKMKFLK